MPHTVLLCLPLVFIRYMSVCAAHRKLHFSSSPLLTAAYAYTVSACLAATAPLVRRSPRPAPNRLRRTRVARARRPSSPAPPAPTPRVRIRRAHIAHAPYRAIHPSRAAPTVPRPAVHPPHRACTHSPTRLLSVRAYRVPAPVPACLPTEVLKLQVFSFYQSISSFVVSLPNVSEKDVKGLLFRK